MLHNEIFCFFSSIHSVSHRNEGRASDRASPKHDRWVGFVLSHEIVHYSYFIYLQASNAEISRNIIGLGLFNGWETFKL